MAIPGNANLLLLQSAAGAPTGYTIDRSIRLNSADSAYLSRPFAANGNQTTWTWSGWVKFCDLSGNTIFGEDGGTPNAFAWVDTDGTLAFQATDSGSNIIFRFVTTQVFRDFSAWYHFTFVFDSNNGTSTDRVRIYVNGTRITAFSVATYPSSGATTCINVLNNAFNLGVHSGVYYLDGYLADAYFIDGQALDPTSFGEFDTNGVWQPIEYTGSWGTNGFHLDFSDNSSAAALGYDAAGSNDWTVNNISVTAGAGNDSLRDSPYNGDTANDTGLGGQVPGNYATLNPLVTTAISLTNGNLDQSGIQDKGFPSTIAFPDSGKWYFEVTTSTATRVSLGIMKESSLPVNASGSGGVGIFASSGRNTWEIYNNGTRTQNSLATPVSGDTIGVAYDADANSVQFYRNGSSIGSAETPPSTTDRYFASVGGADAGSASGSATNFGQRAFAFQAPSGFRPLATPFLPTPTIEDGSTAMDVALYTGNGSTQTITGLNLSPDLVWIKNRSSALQDHTLVDVVRGISRRIRSNTTQAEALETGYNVTAFNSDGFTVVDDTNGGTNVNGSVGGTYSGAAQYVAWTWDAGSSTVSNTDGSITSSVRANASAGFSIVTWSTGSNTGSQSIGHGLNVSPQFVITKVIDAADSWLTWHHKLGANEALFLNNTNAAASNAAYAITPSATTITVADVSNWWIANKSYLFYCFAPVEGYSAFGSYVGNGSSTDGPFVYTGHRSRWIMIKGNYSGGDWLLVDTARPGIGTYNVATGSLAANLNNNEGYFGANNLDILSNGFKIRSSNPVYNTNTTQYVFASFAENPFKIARAR